MSKEKDAFESLKEVRAPKWAKTLASTLIGFFAALILLLALVPWQQTSKGAGEVIAYDPDDRVQNINATVSGRLNQWFVRDGSKVKKGEPIVGIEDIDPGFIGRLELEKEAAQRKYEAAKEASETALSNYQRQQELFEQGLSSKLEVERAKIEYKKLQASQAEAAANIAQAEVKLERQKTQMVVAPKDGIVLRTLHGSGSVFVKKGDTLAVFVPANARLAAEIFISGNDLPLVYPGRKARLQFEGWPAVQFSGWPSVAVGTFEGVVSMVDASASKNGKFRVILIPAKGEKWPDEVYLRQGTRVFGWVLLETVTLGYELWRTFNGFPPSMESRPIDPNEAAE